MMQARQGIHKTQIRKNRSVLREQSVTNHHAARTGPQAAQLQSLGDTVNVNPRVKHVEQLTASLNTLRDVENTDIDSSHDSLLHVQQPLGPVMQMHRSMALDQGGSNQAPVQMAWGDWLKGGARLLGFGGGAYGGYLAGAKAGAMMGSYLGPYGTLIGGALGSIGGGLGGYGLAKYLTGGDQAKPPENMTDFDLGKYGKGDWQDMVKKIPKGELKALGVSTSSNRMQSSSHPELFRNLGLSLTRMMQVGDYRELMSKEGKGYDEQEFKRLVKGGETSKSEGLHSSTSGSFVFGEKHGDREGKALLAEYLAQDSEDKPTTLYMEILSEAQPLIDLWGEQLKLDSEAPMPLLLNKYLTQLDQMIDKYDMFSEEKESSSMSSKKVGYKDIVATAMKNGINVIGMDTLFAKDNKRRLSDMSGMDKPEMYYRDAAMNQSAFEIIRDTQKQTPGKYIVFTGTAHATTNDYQEDGQLLGLSERLGIPAVDNEDMSSKLKKLY